MDINVTGRKMNVGEALTGHATEKLQGIADKYFTKTIAGSATFSGEGHSCRCDISLHPNQGINLHARSEATDPYAAFDSAADKVEKQLRRYKRRLKNHHNADRSVAEMAPYAVLAGADTSREGADNLDGKDESDSLDQPMIIAENHKRIPRVTVGDAVMLMDLEDAGAFMFRNSKTDKLEVIYRRSDGNIGWLSPEMGVEMAAE